MSLFQDRTDAGKQLAQRLSAYAGRPDVVVLALPRGGVPVGYEIARALDCPLDIFLVRKLGVPGREELAMGAIASGGVRVLNDDVVKALSIRERIINAVAAQEQEELQRRERAYRGNRSPPVLRDQTVILADDGLATGASMRAAVAGARAHRPATLIVAVPVAAAETHLDFQTLVDDIVCLATPDPFLGVGYWYEDFSQISDAEVGALLEQAASLQPPDE